MYDGRFSQGDLELTEKHTLKVGLAIPKSLKQTVPAKSCLGDDNHFLLLNDLSKLKENETGCIPQEGGVGDGDAAGCMKLRSSN